MYCEKCYEEMQLGLAGSAMCFESCKICKKPMSFGSTFVDKFCEECSVKNEICRHCGKKIDFSESEE